MRRSRSTHQDIRARRRQMVTYALGVGAFVLFVNAVVGDNGYLAALRSSRDQATLAETLQKVNLENDQLQDQIQRLRDDKDSTALEEAARRYLNLIKPGETLVIIKDARPVAQPPAAPAGK